MSTKQPETTEGKRAISDREWWQSMLPPGWTLYGWSYRRSASAITPDFKRSMQLDPKFLCDMHGKDFETEVNNAR